MTANQSSAVSITGIGRPTASTASFCSHTAGRRRASSYAQMMSEKLGPPSDRLDPRPSAPHPPLSSGVVRMWNFNIWLSRIGFVVLFVGMAGAWVYSSTGSVGWTVVACFLGATWIAALGLAASKLRSKRSDPW